MCIWYGSAVVCILHATTCVLELTVAAGHLILLRHLLLKRGNHRCRPHLQANMT